MTCNVRGCGNYLAKTKKTNSAVKYFSFPKDPEIAAKWREVCGKENINPQYGKLHTIVMCWYIFHVYILYI